MKRKVSVISSILLLIAILDDFVKGHLEICISDEMESLTELAVKYPSERTVNASSTTPLYFGLMIALSEDSDYLNTTVTTVQLALDEINSDSDILRGYSLHYTLTVSQCFESDLADMTITQLFGTPDICKLGLIEAGCTDGTVSLVRSHWVNNFNIPQITCSPTVQEATDDLNMFEVSPANDVIVPALVELITHYNWKQLALIVENKLKYSQVAEDLKNINVTLTVTSLSVENRTLRVEDDCDNGLFDKDVRIFLLSTSSETARYLLCEAFKSNMRYPRNEFILVSNHDSDWWVASPQDDLHYGCSSEQRAQVLNYSLAFQWRPSNLAHKQESEKKSVLDSDSQGLYCYDAVWILAMALNKTISEYKQAVPCIYENRFLASQFRQNILETNLNGQTGEIKFGTNGVRKNLNIEVLVKQYQTRDEMNLRLTVVGTFNHNNFTIMKNSILWPYGIPYNGSPVHVLVTVSVPLTVVYYTMATVGIILSIACCVFNFVFRKTKIVSLTSPNLNYLIIIGGLFFYISTYWYCLPSVNPDLILTACCFEACLQGVGYFLTIGTIVAKLWRIYYIFGKPESVKKRTITDCHLLVFIILLVLAVAVVLLVYVLVEIGLPGYELSRIPNADHPSEFVGDARIDTRYEFYTCSRVPNARIIFSGVIFGFVCILMACALFMAIKTRKVHIKELNDAKYITAIVYVTSLGSMIHIVCTFTLRTRVDTFPAALTGIFMLLITVVLGLVFVPKMITLYRDHESERVLSNKESTHFTVASISDVNTLTCSMRSGSCVGCQHLQTRVKDLEESLAVVSNYKGKCIGDSLSTVQPHDVGVVDTLSSQNM